MTRPAPPNLSVLERDMLAGLPDPDDSALFLRLLDRLPARPAEAAVWEWQMVKRVAAPGLITAARLHGAPDSVADDVLTFIRERQFRRYAPDGRKLSPLGGPS